MTGAMSFPAMMDHPIEKLIESEAADHQRQVAEWPEVLASAPQGADPDQNRRVHDEEQRMQKHLSRRAGAGVHPFVLRDDDGGEERRGHVKAEPGGRRLPERRDRKGCEKAEAVER